MKKETNSWTWSGAEEFAIQVKAVTEGGFKVGGATYVELAYHTKEMMKLLEKNKELKKENAQIVEMYKKKINEFYDEILKVQQRSKNV